MGEVLETSGIRLGHHPRLCGEYRSRLVCNELGPCHETAEPRWSCRGSDGGEPDIALTASPDSQPCADQTTLRPLVRPASAGRTAILAENWRVVSLGHAMRLHNRAGVATGATSSSCNANRRPETSMKPLTAKPTPFVLNTQIHNQEKHF